MSSTCTLAWSPGKSLPGHALRFVSIALIASCATTVFAKPEAVEALIKRQSQEFSDASAKGDAATLAKYLDDNVTFMSDGGEVGNKKDLIDGTRPNPAGVSNHLVQGDWHFQQYGNIAVTSFTDNSTVTLFGQTIQSKFRSTEVWREDHGAWKMISSQTMPVADDPPAIALSPSKLDEYVGKYQASPEYVVTIARGDDGLTMQAGTAAAVSLKAEAGDVFFAAGQPRLRRIFQRDATGRITGFVSRREGHDLVLTRLPAT